MNARGACLFVASLSLGACELRAGAGLDPFPSDGVAGFGRAELVDVCIGAARAVPGAGAAVCVPDGSEPLACAADEDCPSPERCQCGRCFVEACDAESVCPSGEACRGGRCTLVCTQDADCPAGGVCEGGGCTRECGGDADCSRGEVCDFFGVCAAQACSAGTACGGGYTCEALAIEGDVREPEIVHIGEEDVVFFELRSKGGAAVYRARIEDPSHLTADPATPVLTAPAGETHAGAPSALVDGAHVTLFVRVGESAGAGAGAASTIGMASSSDGGRTFEWASPTALVATESWEEGAVGAPAAFEHDGAAYVLYEGGAGRGVGLAKLSGASLARVSPSPVLLPEDLEDARFWRSLQAIGSPFVHVQGDTVRVYVTARGIEGGTASTPSGPVPAEANDSIGFFATLDLEAFERYPTGPVYTTTSGLYGALGEREPAVRLTDQGADLYFVATDASGSKSSGLSRASTVR